MLGEDVDVDTGVGYCRDGSLRRCIVRLEAPVKVSMIDEREQRLLRDRVDRARSGQTSQVVGVREVRVLGGGGCPQDPLRAGSGLGEGLPALIREQVQVGGVGLLRHRQPKPAMQRGRQQRVGG